MATQAQVDDISKELQDAFDGIHAEVDQLNAEIAKLQAAQDNGQEIDLTELKAKADNLKSLVPQSPPSIPASPDPSTGSTSTSGDASSSGSTGTQPGDDVSATTNPPQAVGGTTTDRASDLQSNTASTDAGETV